MPELGSNILANILAAIALGVLGWLLSVLLRLPFICAKRRQLFKFLGLSKSHPRFIVYFSTVFVVQGGSVDFRGRPRNFSGPAVPAAELSTITHVAEPFRNPLLDGLPAKIRKWLAEKGHWSLGTVSPIIASSPLDRKQVEQGSSILAVGSQYYNTAADLYTESGTPVLKMEQTDQSMVITVQQGPRKGDRFKQRVGQADDLAIVEKIHDAATDTTVFLAAGLGVTGTKGAVYFLIDNWAKLLDEFGTDPFALCLRFQDVDTDPNAFRKPLELSRFRTT